MRKRKLKYKIKVTRNNNELYFGKPIDLPIKESYIIKKSIELFDDENPCIIHQSYVVKEYIDSMLELFPENDPKTISGSDYVKELSFLDYININELNIELVG